MILLWAHAAVAGVALERVDVLSGDPGTWLYDEAPAAWVRPATAALRLVEQVQPVWRTPWEGWALGTSVRAISVLREGGFGQTRWHWAAGVQTALMLPRGAFAQLAWQSGRLRLALGVSAFADATWLRPAWTRWRALPTLGISIVRREGSRE